MNSRVSDFTLELLEHGAQESTELLIRHILWDAHDGLPRVLIVSDTDEYDWRCVFEIKLRAPFP